MDGRLETTKPSVVLNLGKEDNGFNKMLRRHKFYTNASTAWVGYIVLIFEH